MVSTEAVDRKRFDANLAVCHRSDVFMFCITWLSLTFVDVVVGFISASFLFFRHYTIHIRRRLAFE